MKTAIIGFGTAGEARLAAYRAVSQAWVVAVVDPNPDRRARVAALDASVQVHASLADLFDSFTPDVVDICAPPAYHRDLTLAALAAGCHVICEKPVAYTEADADDLVAAARDADRLLYPAHNYLFSPMMRALRQVGAAPATGGMNALFDIRRDRHARGVAGWRPDWRTEVSVAGGGILLDHGSHCVYMTNALFGSAPHTVRCTADWAGDDPASGVDLAVRLRLEYPTGPAQINLSWISNTRSNLYRLTGPAGTVAVDGGTATVDLGAELSTVELASPLRNSTHEEWFPALFADFHAHVEERRSWEGPLTDIVDTARVLAAAYRSARAAGAPITLADNPADIPVTGFPAADPAPALAG